MTQIKCPGCDLTVDAEDLKTQREHIEAKHPELIERRLTENGFVFIDGRWVDAWSA